MRYGLIIILSFYLCSSTLAQNIPLLQHESDDYSTYLLPSFKNGMVLLEANKELFQSMMKQYQYQEFNRGFDLEYLAPSTRVNQLRLIRKEVSQVQFLFSPTKLIHIQQLEQVLKLKNATLTKDSLGTTWYQIPDSDSQSSNAIRVGIKIESDSEDRVGRTWTIWSSLIIFSR